MMIKGSVLQDWDGFWLYCLLCALALDKTLKKRGSILRHSERQSDSCNELSLSNRLLAAVLAPVFFNFSILIILAAISRRTLHGRRTFFYDVDWPFALMALVPTAAGFLMGASRFATLLGHCFYTNTENEKDWRITAVLWVGMIFVACLWARYAPH